MSHTKPASTVFVLVASTAIVCASGSDEPGEKVNALQPEAAAVANDEHAADLKRQTRKVLGEAQQHERRSLQRRHRSHVRELEARLGLLRQQEQELQNDDGSEERLENVRHRIEQLERQLQERRDRQDHDRRGRHAGNQHDEGRIGHSAEHGRRHSDIQRRLEHMDAAVRHLHEGGLPDIAQHVEHRGDIIRRELHVRHDRHHDEANVHAVLREVMEQLNELRRDVGELREAVKSISEDR